MTKRRQKLLAILALAGTAVPSALAQPSDDGSADAVAAMAVDPAMLDTIWVLLAAVLVMFMQCGFVMVETGFTRAKNACNVAMKGVMDFSFACLSYWVVGFGIMFGAGNKFFGTSGWFLHDSGGTFDSLSWSAVPLEAKYLFQAVFCATAATIVAGAVAERVKFTAYLVYSIVISAFIYPIVGHWVWGGGWLAELGFWDFAGSTVVHSVGAWMALTGAIMLGPRIGKYNPDGSSNAIPGHSLPLGTLGVFILWLGWFGFNAGSTMAADISIAHIAVTTNLAAVAGGVGATFTSWKMFGKPDTSMTLNGVLAGLVGVTASCAFVTQGAAIWIGVIAGSMVVPSIVYLDTKFRVDDPIGAISVHGVSGAWGTIALGLFAAGPGTIYSEGPAAGLFYGGGWGLVGVQAIGVLAVLAWGLASGFLLFYVIKHLLGLRVTRDEELIGLDIEEHGIEAYPSFQIFSTR